MLEGVTVTDLDRYLSKWLMGSAFLKSKYFQALTLKEKDAWVFGSSSFSTRFVTDKALADAAGSDS